MKQPNYKCDYCEAPIYLQDWELKASAKHYCNSSCALEYVKANIGKVKISEMKKHVKVTNLRNQIYLWRRDGLLPQKSKIEKERKYGIAVSDFFTWSMFGNDIHIGSSDHNPNLAA